MAAAGSGSGFSFMISRIRFMASLAAIVFSLVHMILSIMETQIGVKRI